MNVLKSLRNLFIARGSAGEVRSLLYVALDQGYLSADEFATMHSAVLDSAKLCAGMIRHLRKRADWKTKLSIFFASFCTLS